MAATIPEILGACFLHDVDVDCDLPHMELRFKELGHMILDCSRIPCPVLRTQLQSLRRHQATGGASA
ncbi:hypothetical protein QWC_19915 [Achromobacter marplatensis]|nr:hypothetical protein QWC_19915 [Achromobacter marplatensis]